MDSPLPFLINVMNEAYLNIGGTGELLSGSRRLHVELLMKSRRMPTPQIEALVDKLMEIARANHDRLMQA